MQEIKLMKTIKIIKDNFYIISIEIVFLLILELYVPDFLFYSYPK